MIEVFTAYYFYFSLFICVDAVFLMGFIKASDVCSIHTNINVNFFDVFNVINVT